MDRRTLLFVVVMTVIFFGFNLWNSRKYDEKQRLKQSEPTEAVEEPIIHATTKAAEKRADEKFYVIETPYQQLVFSNIGGALAEINLPFQSDDDELSVVKEIGFDRQMVEQDPANAHFPDESYFVPGEKASGPFVEKEETTLGGYYPMLRRSIVDDEGTVLHRIAPEFYAMNIISRYPEVARMVYEVKEFTANKIVFEATEKHRRIRKTYAIPQDLDKSPYIIELTIDAQGDREALRGLWLTSGVPEVELMSGRPTPSLKYRIAKKGKSLVEKISPPKAGAPVTAATFHPEWVVNSNGFFGIISDPLDEIGAGYRAEYVPGKIAPSRLVMLDRKYHKYNAAELPGYMTSLPLSGAGGPMQFRIFAGPLDGSTLATLDATYANAKTGANPDYTSSRTYHGYFKLVSAPFSAFLLILLKFFYFITSSWGFSIILLTVALRLMLYPLSSWSMKSMKRMQLISPQVKAIQEKYKKDPKRAQQEIMALYRKKGVNPFMGCLPLLVQMPFLLGMFDLLKSSFQLRGASFIPGWIDNLAAPDVLFSWEQPVFFFGNQFHLLPFILGIVMWFTQRFTASLPKDRSLWTEQQRQQRMMGNVMAIVFAVMFYKFPSGLNLYWLSSMLLGAGQQWIINKQIAKSQGEPPSEGPNKGKKGRVRAT